MAQSTGSVLSAHEPTQSSIDARVSTALSRCTLLSLILILLTYLVLSSVFAVERLPWMDEGWIGCPGYNLAFHGKMATTSLEPTGSWLNANLKGIQTHTYWILPAQVLLQAVCYRIFGFSILTMRGISVFWGAIAIVAWFVTLRALTKSDIAGIAAATVLATDFTFLWGAADGRMDMMCIGLGSAAIAVFTTLRRHSVRRALLAANALSAAALFTHPNGAIFCLALWTLVLWMDRRSLRLVDLGLSVLPYVLLGIAWGLYIAQRPEYFIAQFSANATGHSADRLAGLRQPWEAIRFEVRRYTDHFGGWPLWADPVPHRAIFIPVSYLAAILGAGYVAIRRHATYLFPALAAGVFLFMTFFVGLKAQNYLNYAIPFYAACFGAWIAGSRWRGVPVACMSALVILQASIVHEKSAPRRQKEYAPMVAFLNLYPGAKVMGTSALGFGIGFDRVIDDARLGYWSGKSTEFIVSDYWYRWDWNAIFGSEPAVLAHISRTLASYRVVATFGNYTVYRRR
jgi:hypothetical protein